MMGGGGVQIVETRKTNFSSITVIVLCYFPHQVCHPLQFTSTLKSFSEEASNKLQTWSMHDWKVNTLHSLSSAAQSHFISYYMPETFISPLLKSVRVLLGLSGSSICNYIVESRMKKWSGQLLMYSDIKRKRGPVIFQDIFAIIASSGHRLMICTGNYLKIKSWSSAPCLTFNQSASVKS